MEMKAFEIEDSSSEVSEKLVESNLAGVIQTILKAATDRTNDWVDSFSSQAPPDVASAPGLLAFTTVPISSKTTISANLVHAIHTSIGHNHGYTALSDDGIPRLRLNLAVQAFCHCKLLIHLLQSQLTICILVHTCLVHTCYHQRLMFLYRP